MTVAARDPRAEAQALLADGWVARVLEPSPPASTDPDWYAHDEAARGDVADGVRVVGPTSAADTSWDDLAQTDDNVARFARDRWLGDVRRIELPPDGFAEARTDLNRLAFYVVSPARRVANGKIGLRWTKGGFGTPFFGDDVQIRLDGTELVRQQGDTVRSAELTTLAAAADVAGVALDPGSKDHFDVPDLGDPDRSLAAGADHITYVSEWFGFATAVLEELRLAGGPGDDVSRVQLWPEHFDAAVELGSADAGRRASFGASPGDGAHDEPYLYVAPWNPADRADPYWNDPAFGGAALAVTDLVTVPDQRAAALEFYLAGMRALGTEPVRR